MKKLFIIMAVLAILGCEKERCFECVATVRGGGMNYTQTTVVCGTMTRQEAQDQASSVSITGSGINVYVNCKEQ